MSGEMASSSEIVLHGIDDVEDYIWANEGPGSLPWDQYSNAYVHVKNGNQAFQEQDFEKAIKNYSRANNIKPGDPIILGNRSAAYIRISQFLKLGSPSDPECTPLNGLDMTTLAELALKDAETLMNLQKNAVRSYILKANALILLERYEMARDIILSGLQLDPSSAIIQATLQSLEGISSSMMRSREPKLNADFDCTICTELLYEPITTSCGHSFCRSCLFRTMDHSNKCPSCRRLLFVSPRTFAINVTLNNIIQKNFPKDYAKRKSENDKQIKFGNDSIPLLIMEPVVIPCQNFPLQISKPICYRLMVRRIMEGDHRTGMVVGIDPATGSLADFGCEVEITDCEQLPDGSFELEIKSRQRFRILSTEGKDGYLTAKVERAQDIPPTDPRNRNILLDWTNNAADCAQSWLSTEKRATQDQKRLDVLYNLEVMMPDRRDPESFSFWLSTLSNQSRSERLELLRIRNTVERIRRGFGNLETRPMVIYRGLWVNFT